MVSAEARNQLGSYGNNLGEKGGNPFAPEVMLEVGDMVDF